MTDDPLLQPFQLKHLTLKNRVMSTSHEPAYSEDGMPKDRYRAYHVEKAKGGLALTMTAGTAVVSPDSPPAFGNLLAYIDEIVPWIRRMTDEIHEHDCAAMIQISHLGRRTGWGQDDWLPVVAPSALREPAHRSHPKEAEDWDIHRIVGHYADAAERMQAGGMDGIEIEAYGHLFDQFWSPATNQRTDEWGGSFENRMRFPLAVLRAIRERVGTDFIVGVRMAVDETPPGRHRHADRPRHPRAAHRRRPDRLRQRHPRQHRQRRGAQRGHPHPRHAVGTAPRLRRHGARAHRPGGVPRGQDRRRGHRPPRHPRGQGRHDRHDPRPPRRPVHRAQDPARAGGHHPPVRGRHLLPRPHLHGGRGAVHPQRGHRPRADDAARHRAGRDAASESSSSAPAPAGWRPRACAASAATPSRVLEAMPWAGGQLRLAARNPRRRDLMGIVDWRVGELERLGVDVRYDTYADADRSPALQPDVVIVATGGLPQNPSSSRAAS